MTSEQIEAAAMSADEALSYLIYEYANDRLAAKAIATLRAALAAAEAKAWCADMTKAPRDGTNADVWVTYLDFDVRECDCTFDAEVDGWLDQNGRRILMPVTHWRLPPAPPEAG